MPAQDAVQLLKDDHEQLRKLLKELTDTTTRAAKTRPRLLAKIKQQLEAHTTIEEEIFYPAFRDAGGDNELYFEAFEEHRAVEKLVLPDLEKTDPTSEKFSGRAKVLKELVEHHADEEEEDMFPQARKKLGKQKLKELGEKMREKKQTVLNGK
jgi:hemerythrin-like domain-containing protein